MKKIGVRKFFGIYDLLLILGLTAIPLIMLGMNFVSASNVESPQIAIYVRGELYGTYDLSEPATININNTNTLQIEGGQACMIHANCPDQICVHSAPLNQNSPGSIVCLPNGIVIKVINGENPLSIDGYVS